MRNKTTRCTEYHLILDETEATWLRNLMREPIGEPRGDGIAGTIEETNDTVMRQVFLHALNPID